MRLKKIEPIELSSQRLDQWWCGFELIEPFSSIYK